MPTAKGLSILESIKAKHFPSGYKHRSNGCSDYRFTAKGQAEYRRGFQLCMARFNRSLREA
ncbi:hypothetical protein [Vibrio owensii]|uniref:hypothetical protein n=1 Tax=Vibrio owensii TaxID=696485 RepID=UPI002FEFD93B